MCSVVHRIILKLHFGTYVLFYYIIKHHFLEVVFYSVALKGLGSSNSCELISLK